MGRKKNMKGGGGSWWWPFNKDETTPVDYSSNQPSLIESAKNSVSSATTAVTDALGNASERASSALGLPNPASPTQVQSVLKTGGGDKMLGRGKSRKQKKKLRKTRRKY
jgi:hypothetical protein